MKKSIISSIIAVSCVSAVIAAAVFLPAVVANNGYSIYTFDYTKAIGNSDNFNLQTNYMNGINVGLKEAILGTTKINNGDYVLYIGSEAYGNNRSFLYKQSDINIFQSDPSRPLDTSDFGNGLQYLNSNEFKEEYNKKYKTLPAVVTYVDSLTLNDFTARDNYENLVKSYKKLRITNDGLKPDEQKLSDAQLKENKKKYDWANSAPAFSFEPGKSYIDVQGNKKYFRDSYQSGLQFNEIYNFVVNNFKGVIDISSSNGIVLGYRKGSLARPYSGTFTSGDSSSSESSASVSMLARWTPATSYNTLFAAWLKLVFIETIIN